MKAAVLITGNPRTYVRAKKSLLDNVIGPLEADVFFWAWDVVGPKAGASHLDVGHTIGVQTDQKIDNQHLIESYSPVRYEIAKMADYEERFRKETEEVMNLKYGIYKDHPEVAGAHRPMANRSMWYTWQAGFEMIEEYSKEYNIHYDVVFRTRFDIHFSREIHSKMLEGDCLKFPVTGNFRDPKRPNPSRKHIDMLSDFATWGSFQNMKVLCSLYSNLDSYFKILRHSPITFNLFQDPHRMYSYHLIRRHGICVEEATFACHLQQ